MELRLQPLRVPAGWRVVWNTLYEIDPALASSERIELRKYFSEDLLHLVNDERNQVLDVGWYPDGNVAEGAYKIDLYEGDCLGPLLHEFTTRDRKSLVAQIERLLVDLAWGAL